jgi:hypothetical protein
MTRKIKPKMCRFSMKNKIYETGKGPISPILPLKLDKIGWVGINFDKNV